jgi:GH15 family glucan-1,4-alpha-glucosidase
MNLSIEAVGAEPRTPPARMNGYAPIREYAAIGDGRTVALVASDGAIDWLSLPALDSPAVFARLLDAERGGACELAPEDPSEVVRRYIPGTCVLQTIFRTARGTVRVTDALTVPGRDLSPVREVARRVEGLGGRVRMRWRVRPRFGYGSDPTRIGVRSGVPVAVSRRGVLAVLAFGMGDAVELSEGSAAGGFTIAEGERATLCLSYAEREAVILPARDEVERRLDHTVTTWQRWSERLDIDGPWRYATERSALTLKLLCSAPSGAIAAAATTSLPEVIGGGRNWDYRFCWTRDAAFTLDALLGIGCAPEAQAYFWWLMHASQRDHPRLRVLYRMDGGTEAAERTLDFSGYRSSAPVRVGNGAADQVQHDVYGSLLDSALRYADAGLPIDRDIANRLAGAADHVASTWREPDAGMWEVRGEPRHFTHSKVMSWVALDRALRLAERGPRRFRPTRVEGWRRARGEVERYVWSRCWSPERDALMRSPDSEEIDAGLLLALRFGFADPARLEGTVAAIEQDLRTGPYVTRYSGADGLPGEEGAFLACSFWLVDALARLGRRDEAVRLMDELVDLANDVGIYAEEIDPVDRAFLGDVPQGLTHLALIEAALTLREPGS